MKVARSVSDERRQILDDLGNEGIHRFPRREATQGRSPLPRVPGFEAEDAGFEGAIEVEVNFQPCDETLRLSDFQVLRIRRHPGPGSARANRSPRLPVRRLPPL